MFNRILLIFAILSSCAIGLGAVAKNSNHHNGRNALQAEVSKHNDKNGKHQVGKHGKHTVFAEVKNKKVVSMSAGDLRVRKVKSNTKMAELDRVRLASNGDFKIAQADVYYGYCFDYQFDDGVDEHCYWYTADDVLVDDTWVWYSA